MSEIIQNSDRYATAKALLIDLFRTKPEFLKLLSTYTDETQEIEDALFNLYNGFQLNTSEGAQLDAIGEIVGVDRESADDDLYRLRIRARILLNLSSGTTPQILELLTLLIEEGQTLKLKEFFPAGIAVYVSGVPTESAEVGQEMARILKQARAAGVHSDLTYSTEPEANTLHWNGTVGQGWNAGYWAHSTEG